MTARAGLVFYDGTCGLCHGFVLRTLRAEARRDAQLPAGAARAALFDFAPLGGATYAQQFGHDAPIPESLVVITPDGRALLRSAGVIFVFTRLSPGWRRVGRVLRWIPRRVRDWGYDMVARLRRRLAKPPVSACPLHPPELKHRFLP